MKNEADKNFENHTKTALKALDIICEKILQEQKNRVKGSWVGVADMGRLIADLEEITKTLASY